MPGDIREVTREGVPASCKTTKQNDQAENIPTSPEARE
jgi:hypothetical protein